mgnify:CR=1 FL=1
MSRDEAPALRPVLLVIGAMFAFSLMVVFTRAADANILGVAAWRAIVVALVFAASAVVREEVLERSLSEDMREALLAEQPRLYVLGSHLVDDEPRAHGAEQLLVRRLV